jgi:hypothetical protein
MEEDHDDAHVTQRIGIPEANRVTRRYTMSEAALKQRRDAAQQPKPGMTGIRNGWKHGRYAASFLTRIKPCRTSCDKYPCDIIAHGGTRPGGDCLDVKELLHVVKAVKEAMSDPKKTEDLQDIASLNIANSIKILEMLQEDIFRDGTIVKTEKPTQFGTVTEYKLHPSMLAIPKMIQDLGMHPSEYMLTPKAQAKQKTEEESAKTLADIMADAAQRLGAARVKDKKDGEP